MPFRSFQLTRDKRRPSLHGRIQDVPKFRVIYSLINPFKLFYNAGRSARHIECRNFVHRWPCALCFRIFQVTSWWSGWQVSWTWTCAVESRTQSLCSLYASTNVADAVVSTRGRTLSTDTYDTPAAKNRNSSVRIASTVPTGDTMSIATCAIVTGRKRCL